MRFIFLLSIFLSSFVSTAQTNNSNNTKILEFINNGDILNNQGRYLSAINQYKLALNLSNRDSNLSDHIDLLYSIGHTFQKSKALDSTKHYFEAANSLVPALKSDSLYAVMYHYKSSYAFALNDNDSAMNFALKSLDYASKIKSNYLLHLANKDIGKIFLHEKNTIKAKHYFNRSLELAKQLNDSTHIYNDFINLGQLYLAEKKYNEAEKKLMKSAHFFKKINDFNGILVSKGLLSQLYFESGKIDKSIKIASEVMPLINQMEFSGKTQKLVTNLNLLASQSKKTDSVSKNKALSAIEENDKINKSNNPKIQLAQKQAETKVLTSIIQKDSSKKTPNQIIEKFKDISKLQDSLYQNALSAKYHELEIKYNTTLKENENLQLKNKTAEQELIIAKTTNRNLVLGITSIAAMSGLVAFFLYARNRKKQLIWKNKIDIAKAKQEEHHSIGNELHDNKAKELETIAIALNKKGETTLSKQVEGVRESIRKLSHELTQMSFDESEFDEQIITIASKYNSDDFQIELKGLKTIDWTKVRNTIKRNLFVVVREGISNAFRHSDATELQIGFERKRNNLYLLLADNGKGFDTSKAKDGKGLANIKVRVKEINGDISINSLKGKGTDIKINILLT